MMVSFLLITVMLGKVHPSTFLRIRLLIRGNALSIESKQTFFIKK